MPPCVFCQALCSDFDHTMCSKMEINSQSRRKKWLKAALKLEISQQQARKLPARMMEREKIGVSVSCSCNNQEPGPMLVLEKRSQLRYGPFLTSQHLNFGTDPHWVELCLSWSWSNILHLNVNITLGKAWIKSNMAISPDQQELLLTVMCMCCVRAVKMSLMPAG